MHEKNSYFAPATHTRFSTIDFDATPSSYDKSRLHTPRSHSYHLDVDFSKVSKGALYTVTSETSLNYRIIKLHRLWTRYWPRFVCSPVSLWMLFRRPVVWSKLDYRTEMPDFDSAPAERTLCFASCPIAAAYPSCSCPAA